MSQELFVNNAVVLPLETNSKIDCRTAMPQVVRQSRSTPTSGPPKVSARAPAHRSYHFRGVKLKSCIKKIHHNLYISKQANVRMKHADTEGASHKKIRHRCQSSVGHSCRHCETKAMTLKNMKKVIKTQYHLNSLERTFLFANAVMTLS